MKNFDSYDFSWETYRTAIKHYRHAIKRNPDFFDEVETSVKDFHDMDLFRFLLLEAILGTDTNGVVERHRIRNFNPVEPFNTLEMDFNSFGLVGRNALEVKDRAHAENYYIKHTDRHIIFPESADLVQELIEANYALDGFVLDETINSGLIMMPKGALVDGHQRHSVGFCIASSYELTRAFVDDMCESITPRHRKDFGTISDALYDAITKKEEQDARQFHEKSLTLMSANMAHTIAVKDIPSVLSTPTDQLDAQWAEHYGRSIHELVEEIKVVISILVYIQALGEDVLVDGFPKGETVNKQRFRAPQSLSGPPKAICLKGPKRTGKKVKGHYRRFHFRTLTDERYYQNEHANKPRGSRVVFVSHSLVAAKNVSPHVLTDGTENESKVVELENNE